LDFATNLIAFNSINTWATGRNGLQTSVTAGLLRVSRRTALQNRAVHAQPQPCSQYHGAEQKIQNNQAL